MIPKSDLFHFTLAAFLLIVLCFVLIAGLAQRTTQNEDLKKQVKLLSEQLAQKEARP